MDYRLAWGAHGAAHPSVGLDASSAAAEGAGRRRDYGAYMASLVPYMAPFEAMAGPSNTSAPLLGRLEPMDPRQVWAHEAHDFTPWLFQNADRLAEKLGIEIDFEAMEQPVGPYFLDLIGRDQSHGVVLLVENQLAESDHTHLGQLLTYAAGTDASTIVWITTRFHDQHRQALTWLNEHTNTGTFFFGVELKLVRIGDSLPAPDFDIVVMPNDWQKAVRQASETAVSGTSPRNELYRQFWGTLLDRIKATHPDWSRAKTPPVYSWFVTSSAIPGCNINAVFGYSALRVELYIDRPTAEACQEVFDALSQRRAEFEAAYGRMLNWDPLETRKVCKVFDSTPGDITQTGAHEHYLEWFLDGFARMRKAIDAVNGQSL